MIADLADGRYHLGSRLPAERELATQFGVSRPTVREAIIALEGQGLVEVPTGAGAFVRRLPNNAEPSGFDVTAFELTEARLLIEGEAAALAATEATDEKIEWIATLPEAIELVDQDPWGNASADRAFHLAIAKATRNGAIYEVVRQLWEQCSASSAASLLHETARAAMRTLLVAVLDSRLFASEERAVAEARRAIQQRRECFAGVIA